MVSHCYSFFFSFQFQLSRQIVNLLLEWVVLGEEITESALEGSLLSNK